MKTTEQYDKVNFLGLALTSIIYFCVSLICLFMFGESLGSSVLDNIGALQTDDDGFYWEAIIIQISFMIVLVCHIPFIFFSGKEALLIMIDEI